MAVFKVELDQETYEQLVVLAFRECRPPSFQVEWMLRNAIRAEHEAGMQPREAGGVAHREEGAPCPH
jgi:predicted transcriptional regulator